MAGRKRRPGKVLFTLNICGARWEVRVAPEKSFRVHKDRPLHGMSEAEERVIYLDVSGEECMRNTFFHEMVHSVFSESGMDRVLADWMTRGVAKKKPVGWDSVEEAICILFARHLVDTMERNGMFEYPRKLRGR